MLQFIEMNMSHYPSAFDLWHQLKEIEVTVGDTEQAINNFLSRNQGLSFVCIDSINGSLVATILCGHDGRRGYLYHLAVKKEYRHRAIATKLIQLGLDRLKKEGIERCFTMIKESNGIAKKFWKNMGWKNGQELLLYSFKMDKENKTKTNSVKFEEASQA